MLRAGQLVDFLITGRAGGKTFKALSWLDDYPRGILITHSAEERNRLWKDYPEKADRIFSITEARSLRGRDFRDPIFIDNLDLVLQTLLPGARIAAVTASGEVLE